MLEEAIVCNYAIYLGCMKNIIKKTKKNKKKQKKLDGSTSDLWVRI
jgi:hypothetical protein